MENVRITKGKIKDDLFLEVEFTEDLLDHKEKETKLSCTIPVHQDMKDAFAALNVHIAILCDELVIPAVGLSAVEQEMISKYGTRSFSIGGNDEHEGVTVSGYKNVKHGMVNLNTPFQKWSSDYPQAADLAAAVETCIHEIKQYLFEGKRAPEQQLSMDFNENDDDKVEGGKKIRKKKKVEGTEEAPKKDRRSKKQQIEDAMKDQHKNLNNFSEEEL